MSNIKQYAEHFTEGLKISVGIPMENNEIFRDSALITGLEEDILHLQLSRDVLPAAVHLVPGVTLEFRLGKEGKGFRCGGFFVSSEEAGKINAHLTGDVGTSELREFYRIDMFLPYRYSVASTQNLDIVLSLWRSRRQQSLAEDAERKEQFEQKKKELIFRAASGELTGDLERGGLAEEFSPIDESWNTVNAFAINISAGGFKFVSSDPFAIDDLVFFEVLIPGTPQRIMQTVVKVVFKNRNYSIHDGNEYYNIAVQYTFIDERDRDAVVQHISNVEAARIRQIRQIPLSAYKAGTKKSNLPTILITSGLFVLVLVSLFFVYINLMNSTNEIQDSFQESLKKYIQGTR